MMRFLDLETEETCDLLDFASFGGLHQSRNGNDIAETRSKFVPASLSAWLLLGGTRRSGCVLAGVQL
jgi:hypothetical protein